MRIRWRAGLGTLFMIAIAFYFLLPTILGVFRETFHQLDSLIHPVPDTLYGLKSLQDSVSSWYTYLKRAVTNDFIAGTLIAIGLLLMSFEIIWRRGS